MADTSARVTPSGPTVARGSRVVVVVSRGPSVAPRVTTATVPAFVGVPQGTALERIEEAGFNAQVFTDFNDVVDQGHVIDQFPAAGTSAFCGSEVVALVSNGPAESTAPASLPNIVGLEESEAIVRIRAAGLEPEVVRDHHPNVALGVVAAQLPTQAAVVAERPSRHTPAWLWIVAGVAALALVAVLVVIFGFPTQVTVPNLAGVPQVQAEQTIVSAGLKVGQVTQQSGSNAAEGTVISQLPAVNTRVNAGSAVSLVIAAIKPKAGVPSVVGLSEANADAAITAAGLVVQTTHRSSDAVPSGSVIDQSPSAGVQIDSGTSVAISVSLGPQSTLVTVPDLTGLGQGAALSQAAALGLSTKATNEYSNTVATGLIVAQEPPAGQSVAPGTTMGLSISLGPAPTGAVTLPSTIGQTSVNANSTLVAAGLSSTVVQWDGTGQPANTVVATSPSSGALVQSGSSVVLFTSSGK
jgi:beta-lactam-binding protein with PASTA domain